MTWSDFYKMHGENPLSENCWGRLQKKLEGNTYYVYREDYTLTQTGESKTPSMYKVIRGNMKKVKGTGHKIISAMTYSWQYHLFLNKKSADEYSLKVQEEYKEKLLKNLEEEQKQDLIKLKELAEKFDYELLKKSTK